MSNTIKPTVSLHKCNDPPGAPRTIYNFGAWDRSQSGGSQNHDIAELAPSEPGVPGPRLRRARESGEPWRGEKPSLSGGHCIQKWLSGSLHLDENDLNIYTRCLKSKEECWRSPVPQPPTLWSRCLLGTAGVHGVGGWRWRQEDRSGSCASAGGKDLALLQQESERIPLVSSYPVD